MIRVGITHGDINGIGYEVILKTFSDSRLAELCTPVVYGSLKIAAYHRKALELPPVNLSSINRAEDAGINRVNIINCVSDDCKVELSKATESAEEAAFSALGAAVSDLKRGAVDVLLTAPANKPVLKDTIPDHAQYLEENFGLPGQDTLKILIDGELKIALATDDIPLSGVAPLITKELLVGKLAAFNQSLLQDFNIIKPRIAVLPLNPHTGSDGLTAGDEEEKIILPAMQEAESRGALSFGPYAADEFFGSGMYENFDGVLAMYHDQGLIPFKTLRTEGGLCFTAGLSIVHTAPAQGTGYDIAGQNVASEESFRQALYAAIDIYRNRKIYKEATRNPLRKQYFDKGTGEEKLDLTKDEEADTL